MIISLNDVTPAEFENLIFDLAIAKGLKNVVWRTPGADGGRDIEAEDILQDFSGLHSTSKWFLECKRYTGSVDWPRIYEKVAYADSLEADYLLMCTTSKYTPAAISQVSVWNSSKRRLRIRLWPGHEIDRQLRAFPDICLKYGLIDEGSSPGRSIVTLSLLLSKAVASHHGNLVFSGAQPDNMLLAAQAVADLLRQRMADIETGGPIRPVFREIPCDGRWVFTGTIFKIDAFALDAALSYLNALTKACLQVEGVSNYCCRIAIDNAEIAKILSRYQRAFDAIFLWGDIECQLTVGGLVLNQRWNLL